MKVTLLSQPRPDPVPLCDMSIGQVYALSGASPSGSSIRLCVLINSNKMLVNLSTGVKCNPHPSVRYIEYNHPIQIGG